MDSENKGPDESQDGSSETKERVYLLMDKLNLETYDLARLGEDNIKDLLRKFMTPYDYSMESIFSRVVETTPSFVRQFFGGGSKVFSRVTGQVTVAETGAVRDPFLHELQALEAHLLLEWKGLVIEKLALDLLYEE